MAEQTQVEERQDSEILEKLQSSREFLLNEVHKVIVGQDQVIEQVLIALFVGGHCIVTGVPGLAKTLLIKTLGEVFDLDFKRIQFTPDLMPSDITGTDIIEEDRSTGLRELKFFKGPIFTNILLADEINRTTPKTQSALLEAMQELTVTVQGQTYHLPPPFFVLATQNPIELEGTYPLPEAQLDRFMFNVFIDYLSENDEVQVVVNTTSIQEPVFDRRISGQEILGFQRLVRKVPASESVIRYAVQLVRSSRPGDPAAPSFVNDWVNWGASIRASQYLILGGKARALVRGRYNVSYEDIRALAVPVLRHRILTNFHAESQRISSVHIIQRLLEVVPEPASGL